MMFLLIVLVRVLGILLLFFLFIAFFFISLHIWFHWWLFVFFLCVSLDHPVVVLMFMPRLFMWLSLRKIVLLFLFLALLDFEGRFL